MRASPGMDTGSDKSLALVSGLNQAHENFGTKRVAELEARVARLRAELQQAEAELEYEKTRLPAPGDFVRCPLTNFFGRVTKVSSRPQGRAWIEIVPYLGPDLPGHSTMDLFDSWELIDPPPKELAAQGDADGSLSLPTIAPFMPAGSPLHSPAHDEDDIEVSLRRLWALTRDASS
ncbi:hypothetical protein FHR70_002451 [Microvirga lupini]|uniref:Uncharacterized protein n=1 Tax=Microvirga lupini TaxID=420324 RepID=A0A7W4YWU4_9HYPH|nr:hypothetical protein [Microvirga lupini]MBB3019386.1 hypothetical protein [Microvirga lupini]